MAKIKIPTTHISGNSEALGLLTGPLNKLWRAKILVNRKTSGMAQEEGYSTNRIKESPSEVKVRRKSDREFIVNRGPAHIDKPLKPETKRTVKNEIIIINPNTTPPTSLYIQGKPSSIDVSSEATWAAVKSMGRNNPFMMYTGGEDTISIEISWFSVDSDRTDVINKCRLLESWAKADGYKSSPPNLYISWGSSNLFADDTFILTSANYELSNFQNAYRSSPRATANPTFVDLGALPNHATQKLVFKRVSSINRTHENIVSREKLEKTSGISYG